MAREACAEERVPTREDLRLGDKSLKGDTQACLTGKGAPTLSLLLLQNPKHLTLTVELTV